MNSQDKRLIMAAAKLKKFLLRYYPPGIILQYELDGLMKQKPIDLLHLQQDTDVEVRPQNQEQGKIRTTFSLTPLLDANPQREPLSARFRTFECLCEFRHCSRQRPPLTASRSCHNIQPPPLNLPSFPMIPPSTI